MRERARAKGGGGGTLAPPSTAAVTAVSMASAFSHLADRLPSSSTSSALKPRPASMSSLSSDSLRPSSHAPASGGRPGIAGRGGPPANMRSLDALSLSRQRGWRCDQHAALSDQDSWRSGASAQEAGTPQLLVALTGAIERCQNATGSQARAATAPNATCGKLGSGSVHRDCCSLLPLNIGRRAGTHSCMHTCPSTHVRGGRARRAEGNGRGKEGGGGSHLFRVRVPVLSEASTSTPESSSRADSLRSNRSFACLCRGCTGSRSCDVHTSLWTRGCPSRAESRRSCRSIAGAVGAQLVIGDRLAASRCTPSAAVRKCTVIDASEAPQPPSSVMV